jgi:hypothetical protein
MVGSLVLVLPATLANGTALHVPLTLLWMVVPLLLAGFAARSMRRELVVGTDGVQARVGPRGRHEVRFDDVTQVAVRDGEVAFLASGTEDPVARIPLDMGDRELAAAVGRRIEGAFARFGEVGEGEQLEVARAER